MSEWCKFCKHGYPHFEKGKCVVYCNLSVLNYPVQKDPFDTCIDFENEDDDNEDTELI